MIGSDSVDVARDVIWNGARMVGVEQFFLARFDTASPATTWEQLMPDEMINLQEHAWLTWAEIVLLPDRLEPPELREVFTALGG